MGSNTSYQVGTTHSEGSLEGSSSLSIPNCDNKKFNTDEALDQTNSLLFDQTNLSPLFFRFSNGCALALERPAMASVMRGPCKKELIGRGEGGFSDKQERRARLPCIALTVSNVK